jgi:hypothetical protein
VLIRKILDHVDYINASSPASAATRCKNHCTVAPVLAAPLHEQLPSGTAVTRLAIVGCTEAEIATITGHSLRDVRSILDANYLHRDPALAESAIKKLERGTKSSSQASNRTKTVRAD